MNIDPNILNVILGVAANGLTALIAGSYQGMKSFTVSKEETQIKKGLTAQIRKALEEVSETIDWNESPRIEELCLFIISAEVNAVVRQLYVALQFTDQKKTVDEIQEEFHRLFAYHFGLAYDESKDRADTLFRTLTLAVEKGLEVGIRHGVLSAHEAKSTARFHILQTELLTLKKNVEFLTSRQLDIDAINKFVFRYRQQLADRHGRITPPNFDDATKLHIDSIYVTPNFAAPNLLFSVPDIVFYKGKHATMVDLAATSNTLISTSNLEYTIDNEVLTRIYPQIISKFNVEYKNARNWVYASNGLVSEEKLIGLQDLLSRVNRTVILGNPGGGKSTLTNKICYDFTKRLSTGQQDEENKITPIPVILREYGHEKKLHNYSILQFIEATAGDKYQIASPQGAFEYLLLNGRAAVIFDGLDELLETGYRQEIRDDIESFCNIYPSVPVIITSREVGYEQAPLNREKFETYRLAPFSEGQVSEYVTKWFGARSEYSTSRRKQKSKDFLQESQMVSDLRSNPLMLGLMCNIYRGENYIPKNRPDVYRKCAEMLFERWDRSREIPVTFHFEDDIRPAMAHLAHWIYADTKLQEGVTEQSLIQKAAGYLLEHRYENRDRAERAAREFIEFCRGRAWVFTDAGTDKEGEGLYQFTHRTFLEYFTAVYIVRTHETTEELVQTLLPRIRKREWDIVAQLAFQIKNRSSEGAKDKLLSSLLVRVSELSDIEAWSLLSFNARCLEFMEPSPKVTREITQAFIKRCITSSSKIKINSKDGRILGRGSTLHKLFEEVFRALVSAGEQNRETIAESLKESIIEHVKQDAPHDALTALEIGLHLDWPIEAEINREERPQSLTQFWNAISQKVIEDTKEQILELASQDFSLSIDAYYHGLLTVGEVVERFGIGGLFNQALFILTGIQQEPIAITLIRECLDSTTHSNKNCLDVLAEIGRLALTEPTPSFGVRKGEGVYPPATLLRKQKDEMEDFTVKELLSADMLFGIFVVFAIWIELYIDATRNKTRRVKSGKNKRKSKKYMVFTGAGRKFYQSILSQGINAGTFIRLINEDDMLIFENLKPILLSRFGEVKSTIINNSIGKCCFNAEQENFVRRWFKHEISLVRSQNY